MHPRVPSLLTRRDLKITFDVLWLPTVRQLRLLTNASPITSPYFRLAVPQHYITFEHHIYNTSFTKLSVPSEEASSSKTLPLSVFCTSLNLLSSSPTSSGFATSTSPCIRKNTFWNVCTASKSRWDFSRWTRDVRKRRWTSNVTSERSSRSMAAGERALR